MKNVKPHKRLMLHIQEMYFHYYNNGRKGLVLQASYDEDNAEILIPILCAFNSKLQDKFELLLYSSVKSIQLLLPNTRTSSYALPGIPDVSILTKEGIANAYIRQALNFEEIFLFSLVTEAELHRFGYNLRATEISPFLAERVSINYLTLPNLQKAIILRQEQFITGDHRLHLSLSVTESAERVLSSLTLRGKTVIVGFSGGKDSTATYLVLRDLAPLLGFTLRAVCFAPQFANFNLAQIKQVAQHFGIELSIVEEEVRTDLEEISVCAACARARRESLLRLHPDCLALGHHLLDAAETALMTGIHNGEFFALRESYVPRIGGTESDVQIIRPLIFCKEDEVLRYLTTKGQRIAFVSSDAAECEKAEGNDRAGERSVVRRFLTDLEKYEWFL